MRYEHGLLRQLISNGWQEEFPEQWLESGNPWEFERTEVVYKIHYGGHILRTTNATDPLAAIRSFDPIARRTWPRKRTPARADLRNPPAG